MEATKIDKQIRRYLKSISDELVKSKTTTSLYYYITTGSERIRVRYADHIVEIGNNSTIHSKKNAIDIVRIRHNLYLINVASMGQFTLYEEDVLTYIKSILLVFPETNRHNTKVLAAYKGSISNSTKQIGSLRDRCAKQQAQLEKLKQEGWYSRCLKAETELGTVKCLINKIKAQNTALKNKLKAVVEYSEEITKE